MPRTVHLALWLTESDPIVFGGSSVRACREKVVDFIANAVADANEEGEVAHWLGRYDQAPTDEHFNNLTDAFEPWWCGRFQFTTVETSDPQP